MRPDQRDSIVERFARATPPGGHVGRVRARSGPGSPASRRAASSAVTLAWRWALPVAAAMAVLGAAVWQSDRTSHHVWFDAPEPAPYWSGKGLATPVLPPRAYWTMSAFDEFEQLRGPMPVPSRKRPDRTTATPVVVPVPLMAGDWTSPPSLPLIVIEDITPEPIELPDIAVLTPIALAPIEIVPIDIGSGEQEER